MSLRPQKRTKTTFLQGQKGDKHHPLRSGTQLSFILLKLRTSTIPETRGGHWAVQTVPSPEPTDRKTSLNWTATEPGLKRTATVNPTG